MSGGGVGSGERPTLYKVRRSRRAGEGTVYEYVSVDSPLLGWVAEEMDGLAMNYSRASRVRDYARYVNRDPNVIYHAVVPCQ